MNEPRPEHLGHPSHQPGHPQSHPSGHPQAHPAGHSNQGPTGLPKTGGIPTIHRAALDGDPIELVEDEKVDENAPMNTSKIHAFGVAATTVSRTSFKRTPSVSSLGAIRVRSFHGRMSEPGLEYMDNMINDWLDQHPEIEIKHVTANVGLFEGKLKEIALIVNVWY